MKQFHASRHIEATPEQVWAVLTNPRALVAAKLGITRLEGRIELGGRLMLWAEATGARAFALKVTTFDRPRTLVWQGGMPLGLFRGMRAFALTPEQGGVRLDITETFSGFLSGLLVSSLPDLTPSFERFARGVAQLAKAQTP